MNKYLIIACFMVCSYLVVAQIQGDAFDYNLNSPYDTIVTHLGYLKKGNYYPEIAAQTFSQKYRTQEEAVALAIKLQRLLEESKVDIDLSQVPKDEHYIDPKAKYHKYQLTEVFPEIYLAKVNNQWIYSEETAKSIKSLPRKSYPLGIKELDKMLPHSLKKSFLGIHLWQHALLLLLFLFVTGVYKTFTFFFERWHCRFSEHWVISQIFALKRFVSFIIALWIFILSLPIIQLPAALEQSTIRLLKGASVLAVMMACYEWVNIIVPHVVKKQSRSRVKKTEPLNLQLMLLAKPFMKVLVVLIGILYTLSLLNFDISHMLAGISIGGIGFALASQDTIKNFYGTVTIFMDQPFVVGDTISSGNIQGTVEEIGLRATRIRTHHQSVIYIPNAKLTDTYVDNHGLIKYELFDAHITIAYNTDSTLIEAFLAGLRKIATHYAYTQQQEEEKCTIHLEDVHNSTLKILFRIHVDTSNQDKKLQYSDEILNTITQLAKELGIHLVSLT